MDGRRVDNLVRAAHAEDAIAVNASRTWPWVKRDQHTATQ
jgi:hypothetical protein